mgnify:CR=1 FL=1
MCIRDRLLGYLGEVRKTSQEAREQLNAVQEGDGRWEKLRTIIDSGATVTVVPPWVGKCYSVQESPGSKAGVEYAVANGDSLPNLGQKALPLYTKEGTMRGMMAQVANVTDGLQSVRAMYNSGHIVVLDGPNSYALNKFTGEMNEIQDDGLNYTMESWICPPEELGTPEELAAAGFAGQHP